MGTDRQRCPSIVHIRLCVLEQGCTRLNDFRPRTWFSSERFKILAKVKCVRSTHAKEKDTRCILAYSDHIGPGLRSSSTHFDITHVAWLKKQNMYAQVGPPCYCSKQRPALFAICNRPFGMMPSHTLLSDSLGQAGYVGPRWCLAWRAP